MNIKRVSSPLLSIVLPTLRKAQVEKCLERIHAHTRGIDYEVVVVAPFKVEGERVEHVEEEEPGGSCIANTMGYEHAAGEYIVAIADDTYVTPNWALNMLRFMVPKKGQLVIGNFRGFDTKGERTEPGVYGRLYACFPFLERALVKKIEGFYDTCFHSYYGDPDLSLRMWHQGGKVVTCEDAWIEFANVSDDVETSRMTRHFESDQEIFFERWHGLYGHLAKNRTFADVQLPIANQMMERIPAQPPELCCRLYRGIVHRDWQQIKELVESKETYECISERGVDVVSRLLVQSRGRIDRSSLSMLREFVEQQRGQTNCKNVGEKTRLLLVAPSYDNNLRSRLPPQNVAYLLGCIKQLTQIDIQVVNNDELSKEALLNVVETGDYDILATGGMATLLPLFQEIFTVSYETSPNAMRILCGPVTAVDIGKLKREIPFDIAVMGEGEVTFRELLLLYHERLQSNQDLTEDELSGVDGIVYESGTGDVVFNVGDPPKANPTKIPDEVFWKSIVAEYRHFMTELYNQGKSKSVTVEESIAWCNCPFCNEDVEIGQLNILNLDNKVLCKNCRRLVWIDVWKIPQLHQHGKQLDAFFDRINSKDETFALVGDNPNTRWMMEVNRWGVDYEKMKGIFVIDATAPYQTHAVSVFPISQISNNLPENIIVVQREYSDRIVEILLKGGFSKERVATLYPMK